MLSSVSFSACTPIGLDYTHGNAVELNQNLYAFADGFNMYVSPLLENVRDTTMNNGEVILLTDKYKNLVAVASDKHKNSCRFLESLGFNLAYEWEGQKVYKWQKSVMDSKSKDKMRFGQV